MAKKGKKKQKAAANNVNGVTENDVKDDTEEVAKNGAEEEQPTAKKRKAAGPSKSAEEPAKNGEEEEEPVSKKKKAAGSSTAAAKKKKTPAVPADVESPKLRARPRQLRERSNNITNHTATKSPATAKTKKKKSKSPAKKEKEPTIFEVEKILEARLKKKGRKEKEYLVRWKGFSAAEDTWEPARNLQGCPEILEEFNKAQKAGEAATAED